MYILYTCISERATHWIMKKKVSLYVFYQFNPNKQFANFQIVGIPSSKNILQVRQTELLKIDMCIRNNMSFRDILLLFSFRLS